MTRNKFAKILFTVITIAFVLFIFSNSLFTGPQSSQRSQFALAIIDMMFHTFHVTAAITEHFIRKLAHFTEYFVYGNLLLITFRMYTKKPAKWIFAGLFSLLAVPVLDEFLQTFIQGRSGSVSDVLLDFTGGTVGFVLCLLVVFLIDRRKNGLPHNRIHC